jgi:hypothetical protein
VISWQLIFGYFSFLARDALEAVKMIEKETAKEIKIMIAIITRLTFLCSGVKLRFSQMMSDGSEAG